MQEKIATSKKARQKLLKNIPGKYKVYDHCTMCIIILFCCVTIKMNSSCYSHVHLKIKLEIVTELDKKSSFWFGFKSLLLNQE